MDISVNDLSSLTGICKDCVRNYMARSEFAHAPLRRGIYYGVSLGDISKLRQIYEKRGLRGRNVI